SLRSSLSGTWSELFPNKRPWLLTTSSVSTSSYCSLNFSFLFLSPFSFLCAEVSIV
ncbi:hypothetical protein NDU88_007723, partial [Pleurodeles waltl]